MVIDNEGYAFLRIVGGQNLKKKFFGREANAATVAAGCCPVEGIHLY